MKTGVLFVLISMAIYFLVPEYGLADTRAVRNGVLSPEGRLYLHFGRDYLETDYFSGLLYLDTVLQKSRMELTMHDRTDEGAGAYNFFSFKLKMQGVNNMPMLGTYRLDSTEKIRYYNFDGSRGWPYYPVNASVRLTACDSLNAHEFRLSGEFNFLAARTRYFIPKGEKDYSKARMQYFDTVRVKGRFESIYYNFIYRSLDFESDENISYDTIFYGH